MAMSACVSAMYHFRSIGSIGSGIQYLSGLWTFAMTQEESLMAHMLPSFTWLVPTNRGEGREGEGEREGGGGVGGTGSIA